MYVGIDKKKSTAGNKSVSKNFDICLKPWRIRKNALNIEEKYIEKNLMTYVCV